MRSQQYRILMQSDFTGWRIASHVCTWCCLFLLFCSIPTAFVNSIFLGFHFLILQLILPTHCSDCIRTRCIYWKLSSVTSASLLQYQLQYSHCEQSRFYSWMKHTVEVRSSYIQCLNYGRGRVSASLTAHDIYTVTKYLWLFFNIFMKILYWH